MELCPSAWYPLPQVGLCDAATDKKKGKIRLHTGGNTFSKRIEFDNMENHLVEVI